MAAIAKSAIARIEAHLEKKSSGIKIQNSAIEIATTETEKKGKKEYFVDIPDFSTFKNGKKITKKIEAIGDVLGWTPSTTEPNRVGIEPGVKPKNKEMVIYFGSNVSIEHEVKEELQPGCYYTLQIDAVKSAERADFITMEFKVGGKAVKDAKTPMLSRRWCTGMLQYQVPGNTKATLKLSFKISAKKAWSQVGNVRLHVGNSPGAYKREIQREPEISELDEREVQKFPKKNRLNTGWSIWEHRKQIGKYQGDAYLDNLVRIADFRTVERFWQHWQQLPLPSEFFYDGQTRRTFNNRVIEGLSVFREGVEPKWEDEMNENGGEFYFNRGMHLDTLDDYWEQIVLGMIGETLDPGTEEICGVRVVDKSRDRKRYRLEVWFRRCGAKAEAGEVGEKIKENLKECLKHFGKNVPTFEFRPHK